MTARMARVCLVLNRTLPSEEFPVLHTANWVSSDPLFFESDELNYDWLNMESP